MVIPSLTEINKKNSIIKKNKNSMKKILILFGIFCLLGCESVLRDAKDIKANFGVVPREVILMNYNGDTLETFNTRYITSDSGSSIYFEDENHKRIVLSGGIIVCKEK